MTTVFEALRHEHDKHRTLLDLVAKTKGDSEGRRELFAKLKTELIDHARAEERSFYSELIDKPQAQDKATHSIAEHKEIEDLLEELEDMDFSSSQWLPRFEHLKERVEHHEAEEEHEVFQVAGKVLSDDQKTQLATRHEKEMAVERDNR